MLSSQKIAWTFRHPFEALREWRIVLRLSRTTPEFGAVPWFDERDIELVSSRILSKSNAVLEYGTGSSTLFFAKHAFAVHSVDSSKRFAAAVSAEAKRRNLTNVRISVANMGFVKEWGYPIDNAPTAGNIGRWRYYLEAPWRSVGDDPIGLVVVDGRFRVACAGYSILKLLERDMSNAVIFLDDFKGREDAYGVLSEIATLEPTAGRGVIVKPRVTKQDRIVAFIERSITSLH